MRLNSVELGHILECMSRVHGPGYAPGEAGKLQAKLSIMLQVTQQQTKDEPDLPIIPLPPVKQ